MRRRQRPVARPVPRRGGPAVCTAGRRAGGRWWARRPRTCDRRRDPV